MLTAAGTSVSLDLTVRVRPVVQIVHERLCGHVQGQIRTLLETLEPSPERSDIEAKVWNGSRGRNPHMTFRSSRLLSAQLPLRLGGKTDGERQLLQLTTEVLAVLAGVFHLDPVPHLMRQYVPEHDIVLRRTADNLSGAVARLQRDDKTKFQQLVAVVRTLPEYELSTLEVGRGGFGEVMIALEEKRGRGRSLVPARQVLALIKETSRAQGYQVVLTTHSPVLLNALTGEDHRGVVVIQRDRTSGATTARPLVGHLAEAWARRDSAIHHLGSHLGRGVPARSRRRPGRLPEPARALHGRCRGR